MSNNNLPLDFQHPGGFVENVMNYINETAVCPQPMFALGAALSLAGILYGRRVQSEDGQRTNLLVEAIGYTSSGKDHGLKSIARILDSCNASHLRLGQVTSDSAIEWALKRQQRQILLIDEAGYFFNGVNEAQTKGSPQHAIKPALLELWSSANSRWIGKQRVPKDGKTAIPPLVIENPHLCLYATSQPQILFEGISRNDLRDGWLARNLFFISTTRPKPEFKELKEVPNAIKAEVFAWKGEEVEKVGGGGQRNLKTSSSSADQHNEMGDLHCPPPPLFSTSSIITVPTTPSAQSIFAAFGDTIYDKMVRADKTGDETNYLYGKALENARRIALILAVSRASGRAASPLAAVIEDCDATYATKLVGYLIGSVIKCVRESLSENLDEKCKKRMIKVIATAGACGVTRSELTRKTQFIRRNMREEYLADLIDGGEVVVQPFADGRSHGEKLVLAEYADRTFK